MGIPKQSTSKILPKPMAPPYANQKSKIMTHNIHVSLLHLVHQTQDFNEWVGFRPFKLQIKFLQGSDFFQKYIDGNGNWSYPTETFITRTCFHDEYYEQVKTKIQQIQRVRWQLGIRWLPNNTIG